MPPSSAGASSDEDRANSYNHHSYSAAPDYRPAGARAGDGHARHIGRENSRMSQRKSISPINSYAKSNKWKLWAKATSRSTRTRKNLNSFTERHLWRVLYI